VKLTSASRVKQEFDAQHDPRTAVNNCPTRTLIFKSCEPPTTTIDINTKRHYSQWQAIHEIHPPNPNRAGPRQARLPRLHTSILLKSTKSSQDRPKTKMLFLQDRVKIRLGQMRTCQRYQGVSKRFDCRISNKSTCIPV
jgi:hypothetical protein